jgi:hypothetical protein
MQARTTVVTALQSHIAQTCVKGSTEETQGDGRIANWFFQSLRYVRVMFEVMLELKINACRTRPAGVMNSSSGPTMQWASNDVTGEIAQGGGESLANVAEVANLISSPRATPESEEYPLAIFPSISSSASLSSRASKMSSSSALSVIAATVTSNAQVVGEGTTTEPGLDEFTSQVKIC